MKPVEQRQRVEIAIEENIVESESDNRKSTPKEEEKQTVTLESSLEK